MVGNRERTWLAVLASLALLAMLWFLLRVRPAEVQVGAASAEPPRIAASVPVLSAEPDALAVDRTAADRTAVARSDDPPLLQKAPTVGAVPFRGRVVDARTGDPVGSALAVCGSLETSTDVDGRFTSDEPMPADFDAIEFHSARRVTHIRTAARSELDWLGDERGWLARIRIGPTFRFRVVGAPADGSAGWRLRVVEKRSNGRDQAWGWLEAIADDPPWARYDNPQPDPPAGTETRIEVENFEGTLRGSAPVTTTVGIHPGILLVQLDRELAGVTGRVIDDHDRSRNRAAVFAIPRDETVSNEERWPSTRTDVEGRYTLRGLAPGPYWIHARPRRGEEPRSIAFDVTVGANTAPDIVVPAEAYAGAIEGLLKSVSPTFPSAVVRLRAVDGRSFDHFDVVDPNVQAASSNRMLRDPRVDAEPVGFFEFQQVPEGDYELTVLSSDGRGWSPNPLRVRPPMTELEIIRDDAAATWQAGFDVRDAHTGEQIEDALAQFELDDCWTADTIPIVASVGKRRFVDGARLRWNVHAEGYGVASGTERDFAGTGDVRVATVRLSPGYGARLVLRDARGLFAALDDDWRGGVAVLEHPPITGALVFADGELAATSDESGVAILSLPRKPARIEVRVPGWVVLGSDHFHRGAIVGDTREAVVWLTRP